MFEFNQMMATSESAFGEKYSGVKAAIRGMTSEDMDKHWNIIVSQMTNVMDEMATAWVEMYAARRSMREEMDRTSELNFDGKADPFHYATNFAKDANQYTVALTTFSLLQERFLHLYDLGVLLEAWS